MAVRSSVGRRQRGKSARDDDSPEAIAGTQSLDRGLAVLIEVAASPAPGISLADCTSRLGYSKATTLRMLQTLARRGLVSYQPELGVYSLGPTTVMLAAEYLSQLDVRRVARPHMQDLVRQTNETAHLGVLRDSNVVYVELVDSPQPVRIFSRIGDAIPAHATATGKALLAWLPPEQLALHLPPTLVRRTLNTIVDRDSLLDELALTRTRGYSVDDRENRPQIRGFAAPIFDHTGSVCAAVSIGGPSERISLERSSELGHAARRAARRISAAMGADPDRGPTTEDDPLPTAWPA